MNVSLTNELEVWIEARVASGLYRSSSEVVREAIRLLREREELKELRRQELGSLVRRGLDDVESGLVEPFTEQTVEQVIANGRAHLKRTQQA